MNKAVELFIKYLDNIFVDFDGWYGDQCVDLVQQYNKVVVGGPFLMGAGAVNIWDTYPREYYDRIKDAPNLVPSPGDIIIWGTTYGPNGHIAICIDANVNSNRFTAFSQNDPLGSRSIRKIYSDYNGVLGWLKPKKYAINIENDGMDNIEISNLRKTLLDTQQDRDRLIQKSESLQKSVDDLRSRMNEIHIKSA